MAISVDIHPLSSSLVMYDEPEASTAYALSGHVSVSLMSSPSLYSERPRPTKVLLRSLVLTFEGQTELVTQETGYSATRLIRLTRELAPAQTMLLSNEGLELEKDGSLKGVWNFVFNLPIPGWLPSTDIFGNDTQGAAGTRYNLFAEARFASVSLGSGSASVMAIADAWGKGLGFSSFQQKIRVVQAPQCPIRVQRYLIPPACMADCVAVGCEDASFPESTYLVEARANSPTQCDGKPTIPSNVLNKVEVLVSVPEHISVDDDSLTLTLRMRAADLPHPDKQLRLTSFAVNLCQIESYFKSPSGAYKASFPLPSSTNQPNNLPLLDPHPVKSMYELGFVSPSEKKCKAFADHFSLLPPKQSGRYKLSEGGVDLTCSTIPNNSLTQSTLSSRHRRDDSTSHHVTAQSTADMDTSTTSSTSTSSNNVWCKVEVNVPFRQIKRGQDIGWETARGRVKALRPTSDCPLFSVRHELSVELTCAYGSGEGDADEAVEKLQFGIPMSFVKLPPKGNVPCAYSMPASPALSTFSLANSESSAGSNRPATPVTSACDSTSFASTLPAYSQLFYSNGDRKIDYSIPLPLYTTSPSNDECLSSSSTSIAHQEHRNPLFVNPVVDKRPNRAQLDAPPVY